MRTPKNLILSRESYHFCNGFDAKNQPVWSKDIDERGSVFTHKNACLRSSISYNAGLKPATSGGNSFQIINIQKTILVTQDLKGALEY